ncbi:MAG: hypothetical protein H7641_14095 [Candidatus Heimdallarchaeota archaeon]|nr:hypothetical protein [Candidatus Heimdallarchaeota archaeon]MCK4878693.1 hypothetical protein [Candidatus Heimdallarchaeota archaeon]
MVTCITLDNVTWVGSGLHLLNSTPYSSHTSGELSGTLGDNITFEFNETFNESSLNLSLDITSINRFCEIHLFFLVEGDKSLKSDLIVEFEFETETLEFMIESHMQDTFEHELIQGFSLANEINSNLNLTLNFQGQASYGLSGSITVLAHTAFVNLPIPVITETQQSFEITPESMSFDGEILGVKRVYALSVLNNSFDIDYILLLHLSFITNDFFSLKRELRVVVNSEEQEFLNFDADRENSIELELNLDTGINVIIFDFRIEMSIDFIEISNLAIDGYAVEDTSNEEVYHEIVWNDEINESLSLSPFKPSLSIAEQILNISICISFEGTKIFDGIGFTVFQGLVQLTSGTIKSVAQTNEKSFLDIHTFTYNYLDEIMIEFNAQAEGAGVIYIYNTTTINTRAISHINKQTYQITFEEFIEIETPIIGSVNKEYYDVIFIENNTLGFRTNLSLTLSSQDSNFGGLNIYFIVNNELTFSKSIADLGSEEFSEQIVLVEGYNEIKIIFSISGNGAIVRLEDIKFSLYQSDEDTPFEQNQEFTDIPLFKSPKTILVGIFVLFDCWLIMGIILRIYRGRKFSKKQQTENDEFILEIAQISQDNL